MNASPALFPRKPTFERALAALAHPASLSALGLMLLNDTLLRHWWPSWWTGKLSDLAWLVIAPLGLMVLFGWFTPARREKWACGLSLLLCGLCFTLVKLFPAFNELATHTIAPLLRQQPALSLDPSDLLALPGLVIAAWIWHTAPRQPALMAEKEIYASYRRRSVRGLVVLPLAALLLLADAAAPDYGIVCLTREGSAIVAGAGYSSYTSTDGGLTWVSQPGGAGCRRQSNDTTGPVNEVAGPVDVAGPKEGTVYRFMQGTNIQLSTDGGQTFKDVYQVSRPTQQEALYYNKTRTGNPEVEAGPFSAIADPASGNMLFAMGQEGVLVHTQDGAWVWGKGGDYQHVSRFDFSRAELFNVLLGGMIVLSAILALLVYSTLALRWTWHWLRLVVLILAWLAFLGVDILFPPATSYSYAESISLVGLLIAAVLILPLVIEQTIRLIRRAPRAIPALLGAALLGGLLYFLPYLLWFYNTLAAFEMATAIALALAMIVLVIGAVVFLRKPARVG